MSIVNKIFKSRHIILDMIKNRGYKTDKYENFSDNEIDIMMSNTSKNTSDDGPLDMTFENNNKLYVKYLINQKLRINNLTNLVEDIIMTKLKENDTLIVITPDKVTNDIFDEFIETIFQKNKIFVQLFWIDTLMINITEHNLVPKHVLIDEQEKQSILEKYNLSSFNQLPVILKSDPVAKYHGGKRGDIFKILRDSETSGEYVSYRYVQ